MPTTVPTWALTDALDNRGSHNQTLPGAIRPARPAQRLAGPAFPVLAVAETGISPATTLPTLFQVLDEVPAGHVLVWAASPSEGGPTAAHLGALSIAQLKNQGCAGAVLEGGCRDLDYAAEEGFAVFSSAVTPASDIWRWQIASWNEPVTIGGVSVSPGDLIVGDADGVVVVPREISDAVSEEAVAMEQLTSAILGDVRAGRSLGEAFQANTPA